MPFSQLISPAGIGETLEVGNPVVTNGYIVDVISVEGAEYTNYPSEKFTFLTGSSFSFVEIQLDNSNCWGQLPLFHTMGGVLVLTAGGFDATNIGTASVDFGHFFVTPDVEEHTKYGTTWVSFNHYDLDLNFSACPNVYSALPIVFVEPRANIGLIWVGGLEHAQFGDSKVIPVQKLFPGWTDEGIPSNFFVASEFGFLNLSETNCHDNSGLKYFPFTGPRETRAIFFDGLSQTEIDAHLVELEFRRISPPGEDQESIQNNTVFSGVFYKLRVFETFCFIPPVALQHSLGKDKGVQMFGVPPLDPQVGDHVLIQGPPRLQLQGYSYTFYGQHNVGQPTQQDLVMDGSSVDVITSLHTVRNLHQFIYPVGNTYTEHNPDHEFTLLLKEVKPLGGTFTEYNDLHRLDLFLRYIVPPGLPLLAIPDIHWVSASPREINLFPNLQIHTEVGQPFIYERIFSAGNQADYGTAYLYNTRQYAGPIGLGNDNEKIPISHKVELGERFVYILPTGEYSNQGIPSVISNTSVIAVQGQSNQFDEYSIYTRLDNKDTPVFMYSDDQTDIPLTHFVLHRPNQAIFGGETYSEYGLSELQYFTRRLYPTGWTYPVFTPGLRVTRQLVIFPSGSDQTDFGNLDTTLLDLSYNFQGVLEGYIGDARVEFAVRSLLNMGAGETSDLFYEPWVKLQTQYIVPDGVEHTFYGQNINVVEVFLTIAPTTPVHTEFGGILNIINRNFEIGPESPLPHDKIGDAYLGYFLRELLFGGLDAANVNAPVYVGDNTQHIQFVGDWLGYIGGINNMYYGQPNLPVNQIAKPAAETYTRIPSTHKVDHFTRRVYPSAVQPIEEYGIAIVESNAIGPFTLNVTSHLGEFKVSGLTTEAIEPEGKNFAGYGKPRFDPWYVYMRTDFVGDPYPGTTAWHRPDNGPPFNDERYVRYGFYKVENFNRAIYPVGRHFLGILNSHEIENVTDPSTTQYIFAVGKSQERTSAAFVQGGVKIRKMEPSITMTKYGSHTVSHIITPVQQPLDNVTGGVQTNFGGTRVELFNRRINMIGVPYNNYFGLAWVSRSPRFITPGGVESEDLGNAWVSFYERLIGPEGFDASYTRGYSYELYKQRMKVVEYGLAERDIHIQGVETLEVTQPAIGRVAPCV